MDFRGPQAHRTGPVGTGWRGGMIDALMNDRKSGKDIYIRATDVSTDFDDTLIEWEPESPFEDLGDPRTDDDGHRLSYIDTFATAKGTNILDGILPLTIPYGSGTNSRGWATDGGTWVLKWDVEDGFRMK